MLVAGCSVKVCAAAVGEEVLFKCEVLDSLLTG